MDDRRFDSITRSLGNVQPRRWVIAQLLAGAVAGISAGAPLLTEPESASAKPKQCKGNCKQAKERRGKTRTRDDQGDNRASARAAVCTCVTYLQLGLKIIPCCTEHAKDYGPLLKNDGRQRFDTPMAGDILVLGDNIWGAVSPTHSGHIALVTATSRSGANWNVTVKHANWRVGKIIPGAGPCKEAKIYTFENKQLPATGVAFYRKSATPPPSGPTRLTIEAAVIDPSTRRSIFSGAGRPPIYPTIAAEVQLFNQRNALVATQTGQVAFNVQKDAFVGTIDFGAGIAQESYTVLVKFRDRIRTLRAQVPGIQTIKPGNNNLPRVSLIPGDANDDNRISVLDYNAISSMFATCYGFSAPAPAGCNTNSTQFKGADLDGNGVVNEFDLNIYLRVLRSPGGS